MKTIELPAALPTQNVIDALIHVQAHTHESEEECDTPIICHFMDVLAENGGLGDVKRTGT